MEEQVVLLHDISFFVNKKIKELRRYNYRHYELEETTNYDCDVIQLSFDDTDIKLRLVAIGECCSNSIFKNTQVLDYIIGKEFIDVCFSNEVDEYDVNENTEDGSIHTVKICLNGETLYFNLINYSNGYYDGWMELYIVGNYDEIENLAKNKRKEELKNKLDQKNLELRDDSRLCSTYIEQGMITVTRLCHDVHTIDDIVDVMEEMEYYCKQTDYNKLLDIMYEEMDECNRISKYELSRRTKMMVMYYLYTVKTPLETLPKRIKNQMQKIFKNW